MLPTSIAGSTRISPPAGQRVARPRLCARRPRWARSRGQAPRRAGAGRARWPRRRGRAARAAPRRPAPLRARPTGPMKPATAPKASRQLCLLGLAYGPPERVCQLDLVQAVVAAQHHQQRPSALRHHGHGLDEGAVRNAQQPGHLRRWWWRRASPPAPARRAAPAGRRRAAAPRWPPRRWRRSPRPTGPHRSRRPRREPCTRARRSRPSSPRPTPRGTTRGRSARRCGRRPGRAGHSRGRGPRGRGRRCRSPS